MWVAFLRGLNVGGHRLTNDELAAVFAGIGLTDAAPYQASGNVVFRADGRTAKGLESDIAAGMLERFGYEAPTLVRSGEEVRTLAEAEPFGAEAVEASAGKMQVMLLAKKPSSKTAASVLASVPDDEFARFDDRALFWLPAAGILDSAFDFAAAERLLGVTTMRTQGTLQRLTKKFLRP